jgi:hypothetical protein
MTREFPSCKEVVWAGDFGVTELFVEQWQDSVLKPHVLALHDALRQIVDSAVFLVSADSPRGG